MENNDPRTEDEIQLRRLFVRKTYLLALSFVVAVFVQCLLFEPLIQNVHVAAGYYLAALWMLLFCFVIALCFPGILMKSPANWIFTGVIVSARGTWAEVEAFAFLMSGCAAIDQIPFFESVAINFIVMAVLVFIASKMPSDLTEIPIIWLNVIGIYVLISIAGFLVIETIHLVRFYTWAFLYCILILPLVIMLMMYYAQLTQGGRYNEFELNQAKLGALVLFCSFMVLNICVTTWSNP